MNNTERIAIVAVGYNRPDSMRRLLSSLAEAQYDYEEIPLVISIDQSGEDDVAEVADAFCWQHGTKKVLRHPERLGLRRHIISCGDLTEQYGAVMILEDDLYVSPDFYNYAMQTLEKYGSHPRIAGIALNTRRELLESSYPFFPLHTGYDVYFQQFASSWGQVWNRRMWTDFRVWYDAHPVLPENVNVPLTVLHYPDTSWAKFYQCYVVEQDKYYVFSYDSLSTNFGDAGEHFDSGSAAYQSVLFYGTKHYRMPDFDEGVKYDIYGEPLGLGRYLGVPDGELTCDLWGRKQKASYKRYLLSCCGRPYKKLRQYSMSMKPLELNVIRQIPGSDLTLYDTGEREPDFHPDKKEFFRFLEYGYGVLDGRDLLRWALERLRRKLGRRR
ncbi:MAG: glycosyltransferase [Lachnospiraceae bacterium]|nr:glycosyltransferase [Lachnospiraceae bacterium]MCD8249925.1 glycosyltransferase [Lachnospiraceae bacterium]